MKNFHYLIIFVCFTLFSCKKHNEFVTLPFDKMYILEYNFRLSEKIGESAEFIVIGFCELNKDFSLKYAIRPLPFYNSDTYYNSEDIIPDSLRSEISNTLLKYQTDTTFIYKGGLRLYDGNKYLFIIQNQNQKDVIIKFEPDFLPENLKFVYSYLYESRVKTEYINTYNKLFEMFRNQVKDEYDELPVFTKIIEFKVPKKE